MNENTTPIRSLEGLSLRQHYQLLADLLDFSATNLDQPETRPLRDLVRDPRFAGFTRRLLRDVIRALVVAGLLIRPPQLRARASQYFTSREGLKVLQDYRDHLDRL
jgi:hypothetical protein